MVIFLNYFCQNIKKKRKKATMKFISLKNTVLGEVLWCLSWQFVNIFLNVVLSHNKEI
jgi:hypothetical protein